MKKSTGCLIFTLLIALTAQAERDPFWPIGYEPPRPESESEKVPAPVVKPPEPVAKPPMPPPIKPITEADWAEARKALVVSGYTQARRPDTGETRIQVMINRETFSPGDTLNVTNLNIHFVWHIESIAVHELKLKQVEATRVTTGKSLTHKQ